MPVRKADAVWEGGLKGGHGKVSLGSGAYSGPYSFGSRFADAQGTNPEELIGAAHAGCFAMALSAGLERAGHPPRRVAATAKVHLETGGEGRDRDHARSAPGGRLTPAPVRRPTPVCWAVHGRPRAHPSPLHAPSAAGLPGMVTIIEEEPYGS
jgi:hypothetical protein